MLLGLLTSVVKPEDNVIAIHVEETDDTFDPNTFHIHEDICKSKKVESFNSSRREIIQRSMELMVLVCR